MITHRCKEYKELHAGIVEKIKKALDTDMDVFLVGGSATVMLEAAIRNGVDKKSLGITNGSFGNRSIELGELNGKDVTKVQVPWGEAMKPEHIAGKVGKDIEIREVGLRPGEKLYEELLNDKENTIKTDNEKIMIAKVRKYDYIDVCNNIDNIIELAQSGIIHDMVKSMKQFVPEYKSMHSEYEDIDHELEEGNKSNDSYYFNPTAPVGE